MKRAWPVIDSRPAQAIELYVAEVPRFDLHPGHSLTVSAGRPGVKITGAAEGTVTILYIFALHSPFEFGHGYLPLLCFKWRCGLSTIRRVGMKHTLKIAFSWASAHSRPRRLAPATGDSVLDLDLD